MIRMGLNDRQQEILRWLVGISHKCQEQGFDFSGDRWGERNGTLRAGHAKPEFRTHTFPADATDLQALADAEFVTMFRLTFGGGEGIVKQAGIDAVACNFGEAMMSETELLPSQKLLALNLAAFNEQHQYDLGFEALPDRSFQFKPATGDSFRATKADIAAIEDAGLIRTSWADSGEGGVVTIHPRIHSVKARFFGLNKRRLVLEVLYALAMGKCDVTVSPSALMDRLPVDRDFLDAALSELAAEGYSYNTSGGSVLKPKGKVLVDDPAPSSQSPAGINQYGGVMLFQSGSHASANVTHNTGFSPADILKIIGEIREAADALPPESRDDVTESLDDLAEDVKTGKAKPSRAKAAIGLIHKVTAGAMDWVGRVKTLAEVFGVSPPQ